MSERTGRGGRNEDAKKNLPDTVVLGAVGYMLDNDTKAKEGSLNLTSLFKTPPPPTEAGSDPAYPSLASVQSVAPATPGHPHTGPKLVTVKAEPLDPYQQSAEVSSEICSSAAN